MAVYKPLGYKVTTHITDSLLHLTLSTTPTTAPTTHITDSLSFLTQPTTPITAPTSPFTDSPTIAPPTSSLVAMSETLPPLKKKNRKNTSADLLDRAEALNKIIAERVNATTVNGQCQCKCECTVNRTHTSLQMAAFTKELETHGNDKKIRVALQKMNDIVHAYTMDDLESL